VRTTKNSILGMRLSFSKKELE